MKINRLIKTFDFFSLSATLFLLAIVALNILARQLHDLTSGSVSLMLPGAIELSKYALLFIVFAALPRATTQGMVRVDLLSNTFPKLLSNFLDKIWLILMAGFTAILAWLFINKALLTFSRGDATQDLQMPLFIFYALIASACIATTLSCFLKALNQVDKKA